MPVTVSDTKTINRIIGLKPMIPSGYKWDLLMRISKNTSVSPGMGLHGEPSAHIGITVLFLDTDYHYKRLVCFPVGTEGAKSNFSLLRLGVHLLGGCLRAYHRQRIQCCLVWGSDNSRQGHKAVSHCQVWDGASCWAKGLLKASGLCPGQPPLPTIGTCIYRQDNRTLAPTSAPSESLKAFYHKELTGFASVSSRTEKEHLV